MRRTAASLLLLAGCFAAQHPDGRYYCASNNDCVTGYLCYESYCCRQDRATGLCVDHPCLVQGADEDGDGFPVCADDCDDRDKDRRPGLAEKCDGKDNDCDGEVDEGVGVLRYRDADGDGHGSMAPADAVFVCQSTAGVSELRDDCDDGDPLRHAGRAETCDGKDNDCDGEVDDGVSGTFYPDADGDGYGKSDAPVLACTRPAGHAELKGDCNDASEFVHPDAKEACNDVDDDCDGVVDEGVKRRVWPDGDGDGFGRPTPTPALRCAPATGEVLNDLDCNDANPNVHPAAGEVCNGIDDDCDGLGDLQEGVLRTFYRDADGDGWGGATSVQACSAPMGHVAQGGDCDDTRAAVNPRGTESCNGIDDDCDGVVDEGLLATYFADADRDGFGNAGSAVSRCPPGPAGHVQNPLDCDDARADVWPGAAEACDAVDNDCDGVKDNALLCGPRVDQAESAALWGAAFNHSASGEQLPASCAAGSGNATALSVVEDTVVKSVGSLSIKVVDGSGRDFFAYFPQRRNGGWNLTGQVLTFHVAGQAPSYDSAFRQPLVMFCSGAGTFARYQMAATNVPATLSAMRITVPNDTTPGGPWTYGGSFSWSRVEWIEVHLNNGQTGNATMWLDDFRMEPQ